MVNCVFTFGPENCYFLESPSTWKWGTLPPAIRSRFPNVGEAAAGAKIAFVHNLVFGANGSYLLTWRGKDGKNYQVNSGLPADLTAWLDQKNAKGFRIRDSSSIRLALGPNNSSYFVTDGKDCRWKNLPSGLNTAIEKLRKKGGGFKDAPRLVALGVKGSYVMITEGNGASWNVADEYPELGAYIAKLKAANGNKGGTLRNVEYLSLDAFDGQNYILTTAGGGYAAWVPDQMKENVVAVLKTLPKATAATAARGNSQRASSSGIGGILKLANLLLNAEANAMGSGGGGGGGGGYSGGGGVDFTQANMDFTQGLQNQTWSSVDSAASNWNAQ